MWFPPGSAQSTDDEEYVLGLATHRAWDDKTLEWRIGQFCEMGFEGLLAGHLAASDADLGRCRKAIKAGCPHGLLVEIVFGKDDDGESDE